jgi:hypothetical protein
MSDTVIEPTTPATVTKPRAKRDAIVITEGIGPNQFARMMAKHLNERCAAILAEHGAQELGKRKLRGHLRAKFSDVHEAHANWTLTREMQLSLLEKFGNKRASEYATRALAATKRKRSK